jgi:hypothetical protein
MMMVGVPDHGVVDDQSCVGSHRGDVPVARHAGGAEDTVQGIGVVVDGGFRVARGLGRENRVIADVDDRTAELDDEVERAKTFGGVGLRGRHRLGGRR